MALIKQPSIQNGTVHKLSKELKTIIVRDESVLERWNSLTPLARNEWICWIEEAKLAETRQRRINRLLTDLLAGKRRPCCWMGCAHRIRNGH